MQTETATLLAVLMAPIAVLALVAAAVTVRVVGRARRSITRGSAWMDGMEPELRGQLAEARTSLARIEASLAALRTQGAGLDDDLAAWAAGAAEARTTIERISRGRLAPAVRAVQLAGALARIAVLWRMPA